MTQDELQTRGGHLKEFCHRFVDVKLTKLTKEMISVRKKGVLKFC